MTHLRALIAHYLHYDLETIDSIPYPQILQYLHSIMIINGNSTKWLAPDKATAAKDTEFIKSLDL